MGPNALQRVPGGTSGDVPGSGGNWDMSGYPQEVNGHLGPGTLGNFLGGTS